MGSPSGECPDCGTEYKRLRQHWSGGNDCGPGTESQSSKTTLDCDFCGDSFEKYTYRISDTNFCSANCRTDYQQHDNHYEPCAECGEEIHIPPARQGFDNYYCSKECESAWKSEHWVDENHPSWDGGNLAVDCAECGTTTEIVPAKFEHRDDIYCSRDCADAGQDNGYDSYECGNCGVTVRKRSYTVKGDETFCSDECFSEWLSDQRTADQNPAWRHGITGLVSATRLCLGDEAWCSTSDRIRSNAGWTCEQCGAEPEPKGLHAHHIVPVVAGGTNDDWNLLALCRSCHKRAESFIEEYVDTHLLPNSE